MGAWLTAAAAQAQTKHEYALVDMGVDGIYYVDIASKSVNYAQITSVWLLLVGDTRYPKIEHSLQQLEVSCTAKQVRTAYIANYLPSGTIFSSGNTGSVLEPVIPGSVGETVFDFICNGVDPYPSTSTISDTQTAIVVAQGTLKTMREKTAAKPTVAAPARKERTAAPAVGPRI